MHEFPNTGRDCAQQFPKFQIRSDLVGKLQKQLKSSVLDGENLLSFFSQLNIGIRSVPFDYFSAFVKCRSRAEKEPSAFSVETAQTPFDLARLAGCQHPLPVLHEHV